jgi:hypothetical protein
MRGFHMCVLMVAGPGVRDTQVGETPKERNLRKTESRWSIKLPSLVASRERVSVDQALPLRFFLAGSFSFGPSDSTTVLTLNF